ncbi:PepSY domain-containing protein [Aliibacillus thermotolerans]|uniref:PepSY domain-containing protein n=1 Tax=Aliibacillus thermotolerans TaxID=1834418 RepID=A0ABW0U7Z9_9BACI|nr:PepSY domain-containing protein [Aliibacillus thermotolerans]MDA3129984.1 hypothetical protein [Aliibacillus thermotolerans]
MKKFIIATACVVSLGLVAIGIQQFQATAGDASISKEEAKQIATEQYPGTVTEVERERENGKEVYEMEITGDEYKYELKLDANTGKIVKLDEKEKVQKQINKRSASSEKENNHQQQNDSTFPVSMDEAINIALAETGGTVKEAELDDDDGMTYYEIEINSNKGEAEVEVNAYTGEIIQISYDD